MKVNAVISEMTKEELRDALEEKQALVGKLRIQHAVSTLENPKQLTVERKKVAKLKTEIRKRAIEAAQNAASAAAE